MALFFNLFIFFCVIACHGCSIKTPDEISIRKILENQPFKTVITAPALGHWTKCRKVFCSI